MPQQHRAPIRTKMIENLEQCATVLLHALYGLRCAVDDGNAPTHEQLLQVRRAAAAVADATLARLER